MADTSSQGHTVPISRKRVKECEESARFWASELPKYADRKQAWADFWSITAGLLAAVTSLAIFPVVTETSPDWAKFVVAGFALLSAVCALMPRVKNYGELAGQARELTSRYGGLIGDLLDLSEAAEPFPSDAARLVVEDFESIKAKKDALRDLTNRSAAQKRRARRMRTEASAETTPADAPAV